MISFLFIAWLNVPTFTRRPWDFETYRLAARAAADGLNPYSADDLERVARRPVGMHFFYPPITLPLFLPFIGLSLPSAALLWLMIKTVVLVGLFQIWRKYFVPTVPLLLLCPAIAFAFNGSVIWDLRTGNVTIIQDLLIWLGLAAYVHGRRVLAAVGIVAGSIFKVLPAAFLLLLLFKVQDKRPSWKVVLVSLICLLILVFGASLFGFRWVPHFKSLSFAGPWGMANPSVLCVVNSLALRWNGAALPESSNLVLWLWYVLTLLLISAFALRRAWKAKDAMLWVLTLTPLFVLLNPRPVAYGYFMATPSALVLLSEPIRIWRSEIAALVISAQGILGAFLEYRDVWTTNLAFLVLLAFWLFYARSCSKSEKGHRGVHGIGPDAIQSLENHHSVGSSASRLVQTARGLSR